MSSRELIVLGTASAAPTRHRNHNGYLFRWDDQLILVDPGEGTQRQFTHAGVAAARLTAICITHFHGDHCLGLPGVLQRLSGDGVEREIPVFHPADGAHFFERLRYASVYEATTPVVPMPIATDGVAADWGSLRLVARELDHRITSYGYRLEEPDGVRFDRGLLAAAGIEGAEVGRLEREGSVVGTGGVVHLADVTRPRRGQSAAIVMDTRYCQAAIELAQDVDLLVCESTFLRAEQELADTYGHLTAAQAASIAAEAGAKQLVLTHFSARYSDTQAFVDEAREIFPNVAAVADFDRVAVPPRTD